MMTKLQPYEFELINRRLTEKYGKMDDFSPYFRLVWSDSQFERRIMTHTDEGWPLIHPETRVVPKYKHYIRERYVLEGLQEVKGETDLTTALSYEPIWTFEDKHGNYLIPRWDAIHFILQVVKRNQEQAGMYKKYDDLDTTAESIEKRIDEIEKELYGNETSITDALAYGRAIVIPGKEE